MRHLVLGTAGHIDHGKTTLVRALTGVDTDRLPEEKRRGITIDLGFARLPLAGAEYAVVDVPGHESLVRNMLAGATGIDVVLLVIAADEGVMPQTREHLAIMQLLGVPRAVIALTKADLVDPEWLELAADDVRATLAATPYAQAPLVAVSGVTGAGLAELRAALEHAAAQCGERDADDLFRLPVDRVFTVRGTGTVVTGTVWSGRVLRDDTLRALPGDFPVRARGLQQHGSAVASARAGERVAVALAADRDALARGVTLTDHPAWTTSTILTVRVHVLPDAPPLRARQRVHVHLGTEEVLARVALPGGGEVAPGSEGWAQLRLEAPLLARARDRFVMRSYSPVHTIAGGVVAEPYAPRRKRLPADVRAALEAVLLGGPPALAAVVRLAGVEGAARDQLAVLTGLPPAYLEDTIREPGDVYAAGDRLFPTESAAAARERLLAAIGAAHAARPLEPGAARDDLRRAVAPLSWTLAERVLRELVSSGEVAARGAAFALPAFRPGLEGAHRTLADALLTALADAGLAAPRLAELPAAIGAQPDTAAVARLLVAEGRLVALAHDHFADAAAVAAGAGALRARFAGSDPVSVAALREVLGVSRKYLIPLLEYYDQAGVTRRVGEERAVLPAAPAP